MVNRPAQSFHPSRLHKRMRSACSASTLATFSASFWKKTTGSDNRSGNGQKRPPQQQVAHGISNPTNQKFCIQLTLSPLISVLVNARAQPYRPARIAVSISTMP